MSTKQAVAMLGLGLLPLLLTAGCSQQTDQEFSILDPLGLGREIFGIGKQPVRVGITLVHADQRAAAPWVPMQREMQRSLNQPVQFEPLQPFQIQTHLTSGRLQFAMVGAEDEAEIITGPEVGEVIARPMFEEGANQSKALLVVAADSDTQSIEELKEKRIAFGPIGDPVTHVAAMKMLEANGIPIDSIPRELLPIPGTLRHHLNSFETAKAVIYERPLGIAAGFVAKDDYDKWADTGGSLLLLRISKDQLRVLGETEAVPNLPDGPVLASAKADSELVKRLEAFLTEELPKRKNIRARLGLVKYEVAAPDSGVPGMPEARTESHE
ncbi:MAG: PhnD/SsuA/transferrin family substrate-binding protein [Phycisphaerales bacterium]|nr:MAG: PhnD/SsuA/transferrin family substrate-binding protein [Phycisphaerales bacterium]